MRIGGTEPCVESPEESGSELYYPVLSHVSSKSEPPEFPLSPFWRNNFCRSPTNRVTAVTLSPGP